jgi:glycosyltransferase involved in cell wall biosynthesis
MIKKLAKTLLPPGTLRFKAVKGTAIFLGILPKARRDVHYAEWVERTEPFTWSPMKKLQYQPLMSIVVPVFNPPDKYFLPMVYSVINQTYQNWELVLVNASTQPKQRRRTADCPSIDTRIKVVDLPANKGIAGNTNAGIEAATGDYIGLLDHDDLLAPAALYEMALALQGNRSAGLLYSDEDKVSADGEERFGPHFKPDWSPHLLREVNYLNHFTIIRKTLLDKVAGYRAGFDGAQDYDLFLRLADEQPVIIHVPKVLYHWRTTETSTANDFSKKKNILNAGIRALEDHLERNDLNGHVSAIDKQPGFYQVRYRPKTDTPVCVLIIPSPLESQYQMLVATVMESLKKTKLTVEIYAQTPVEMPEPPAKGNTRLQYIDAKPAGEFIKAALSQTRASATIIINAAVSPKTKDWLDELVAIVEQDESVGIAMPLLVNTDLETIFDAGYVQQDGQALPLFAGHPKGLHTYLGNTDWVRNLDAVSGRCFAIKSDVLRAYTGSLPASSRELAYEDLCGYVRNRDLQIVLWPFTRLVYRGELSPRRHRTEFFNPALTTVKTEFGMPKTSNIPPGALHD